MTLKIEESHIIPGIASARFPAHTGDPGRFPVDNAQGTIMWDLTVDGEKRMYVGQLTIWRSGIAGHELRLRIDNISVTIAVRQGPGIGGFHNDDILVIARGQIVEVCLQG